VANMGGISNILTSLQNGIVPAVFAADVQPVSYGLYADETFFYGGYLGVEAALSASTSTFGSNQFFSGVATHYYVPYYYCMGPHSPLNDLSLCT